ncbi:MAG TPA: chorismate pyruvate-lyase family protein [Methanothermobacter sp.]|nr:conserved hypothetical protein [Methanothermobacter sp. MT-2]HHW05722.1 DUF98 domain-containing protein [Methanothermobacter sp.]HOK72963.1 chorismate pyruvate-lyase family protein [Methanothermobacter sp.]HOL69269.1 chorismate pyruvate-lyase family protein [Methanothermobacter sp.]HPQ04487.1 chorismate pyruvate-lyase family protein [Methanothermobacter sp.]
MDIDIVEEIQRLERIIGPLSNTQKILLATDGSITRILDVLFGKVKIRTLVQEFREANEKIADKLDIAIGEKINYRIVLIGNKEPLIHAISYIPLARLDNDFKEDLIRADIPIGKILRKHNIESRREVEKIDIEEPTSELKKIFQTDSLMLTRTYNIIHKDKILIRIKETFPITYFTGEY